MRKTALLLGALLVLALLAGCNQEKEIKEGKPDFVVPGYDVNLHIGGGWETVPDSTYDLELNKEGVTMMMISFVSSDFMDKPPVEEIYDMCTHKLLRDLTDVKVVEELTTYQSGSNTVMNALYSGKGEEGTLQYYCFAVQFTDEAESMTWVCYKASANTMKNERDTLKAAVEAMTANGELVTQEELDAAINAANGVITQDDLQDEPVEDEPVKEEPVEEEPVEEEPEQESTAPDGESSAE